MSYGCIFLIFMCLCLKISLSKKESTPPLVSLGNILEDHLINSTHGNHDLFLNDLSKYSKMLNDLIKQLHSKNRNDVSKGMAVFDIIEDLGGPPKTILQTGYTLVEEKYKWMDDNEIMKIKAIFQDIRDIWKAMEERANRLRNGIPDSLDEENDTEEETKESSGELH